MKHVLFAQAFPPWQWGVPAKFVFLVSKKTERRTFTESSKTQTQSEKTHFLAPQGDQEKHGVSTQKKKQKQAPNCFSFSLQKAHISPFFIQCMRLVSFSLETKRPN
jgi:hypothetical protein